MIITSPEEWVSLYGAIAEDSRRSEEKHVFIYASAKEADSVAALRILEVSGPAGGAQPVGAAGGSTGAARWLAEDAVRARVAGLWRVGRWVVLPPRSLMAPAACLRVP